MTTDEARDTAAGEFSKTESTAPQPDSTPEESRYVYNTGFFVKLVLTTGVFALLALLPSLLFGAKIAGYLALAPFLLLVALPWIWIPVVAIPWAAVCIVIAIMSQGDSAGVGPPVTSMMEVAFDLTGKYYRFLFGRSRPLLWGAMLGCTLTGGYLLLLYIPAT